jgi:hypothetical protein
MASLDLVSFMELAPVPEGDMLACDIPRARRSASAVPETRSIGLKPPSTFNPPLDPVLPAVDMRSDPDAMWERGRVGPVVPLDT